MTFERTFNYDLVREIITHPSIYPHVSDDGSPPASEYQPLEHPAIWYVLVRDRDELLGMWMFSPQNHVCWEVHTCLYPAAWGERAKQAAREMAEWVWRNTPCRRIITQVPSCNRLALRFAEAAGMQRYGENPASFCKNGKLWSQILLGLSKE